MKETYDQEYFEGLTKSNYGKYDCGYGMFEGVFQYVVQFFLRFFHPRSMLDVGCAYGYITKFVKGMSYGIDISHFAITQRRTSDRVFLASSTHIPFKENTFEFVSCLDILEHLQIEDIMRTFQEIDRVGKKWLFFSVPLPDSQEWDKDTTHVSIWPRSRWIELGESMGWKYESTLVRQSGKAKIVHSLGWSVFIFNLSKDNI